jgi:hypothetical protein
LDDFVTMLVPCSLANFPFLPSIYSLNNESQHLFGRRWARLWEHILNWEIATSPPSVSKKIKIFIWLLFRDRINSKNLLKRKNYNIEGGDYNCVLCNLNVEELSYHLIFQCPFSLECWSYLGIFWDHHLYFFDTLKKAKADFSLSFFMEIFSIAAWEIWKQKNGEIFWGLVPSFSGWRS